MGDRVNSVLLELEKGLAAMGLERDLPLGSYLEYLHLLAQWNTAYNLTAIRDPKKMLAYHILDSLSVLPFIADRSDQEYRCLDIATGAGLPGIILALARPDLHWVLLDGNHKKTRFVQQAVLELEIKNIEIVCCRIEDYIPTSNFTTIVTRAFASLSVIFEHSHHLLAPRGKLLAMKTTAAAKKELEELQSRFPTEAFSTQLVPLNIPGVAGSRSLVKIFNRC